MRIRLNIFLIIALVIVMIQLGTALQLGPPRGGGGLILYAPDRG